VRTGKIREVSRKLVLLERAVRPLFSDPATVVKPQCFFFLPVKEVLLPLFQGITLQNRSFLADGTEVDTESSIPLPVSDQVCSSIDT